MKKNKKNIKTCFYGNIKNKKYVKDYDKLQKDLELLHKWSIDWQMQF